MAWLALRSVRSSRPFLRVLTQRRFVQSNDQFQAIKPFSEIPGPKGLPILGSLLDVARTINKAGDENYFHQQLLKYGPIVKITTLGKPLVVVGTPEAAAKMFRAEGKYPSRGETEDKMTWIMEKINIPNNMAFSKDEEWKRIRSSASKQIVPRRVANYAPGLCEVADDFVEYIRCKRGSDGYLEDVYSALMKWAFQGIGYMTFGEKLDTFDESRKDLLRFQDAAIMLIGSISELINGIPLYKVFPTKAYRHFVYGMNYVVEYGEEILKKKYAMAVEAIHSGVVDETKAISLMEQWLIEGKFSHKETLMMASQMLAGGIDTSSNTSAFLLHEVAKQPELQEKMYKEVCTILGDRNSPSFDDLQKMTLVRGCVKEILRLQPTAPVIPRVIDEETEICGYQIPAKTSMMYSTYSACRDPKYVEDPTSFKPERWARDSPTDEELNAFLSLPFGFGPRSCYGRRLVELELYIMLCMLSKNFKLSTQQQTLKAITLSLVKPNELLKIKFTDRNTASFSNLTHGELREQLDPTMAVPELAYWDTVNQEWREVGATCGTSSAVDWNTYTIAAEACTVTGPQPSTVVLPQSLVTCSGNPCTNAVCLSNPLAVCILNFCGNCLPQWHLNGTLVQCSVNTSYSCYKPLSGFTAQCSPQTCPCPALPYTCPSDSILVEVRQSNCCVTFQCSCPNSSCPLLADGNQGVYPVAVARGNRFPGTCCPNYTYTGGSALTSTSAWPHRRTSALKSASTNHSLIPVNAYQDNHWQQMDLAVEVGL
eukprot:Em0010g968a